MALTLFETPNTLSVFEAHKQPLTVAASDASAKAKAWAAYVCDGVDDQVEIQAAIDACPSYGGFVLLSEGTFNLASAVTLRLATGSRGMTLKGMGIGITILSNAGTGHCLIIDPMYYCWVSDMSLLGNASSGNGIYYNNHYTAFVHTFDNLALRNNGGWGFSCSAGAPGHGINLSHMMLEENALGGIKTNGNFWKMSNIGFTTHSNVVTGIDATVGMHNLIDSSNIEGMGGWGIKLLHGSVINSVLDQNLAGDIWIAGSFGCRIINNYFGNALPNIVHIHSDENDSRIGYNLFSNLAAGVTGIRLDGNNCLVEPQCWSASPDPTAVKVDDNGTGNVTREFNA